MFESSRYSNLLLKESSDMIVIEQVYKAFPNMINISLFGAGVYWEI